MYIIAVACVVATMPADGVAILRCRAEVEGQ
jgi:hypothetical protein